MTGISSIGSRYASAITASEADSAGISVRAEADYDPRGRRVTVTTRIELVEDLDDPEECRIRGLLVEDDVQVRGMGFDRTVRRILWEAPLEVSSAGAVQSVLRTLEIPEGWKPESISAVVWVQRDSSDPERHREVLNAGRAAPLPATPVLDTSWGEVKRLFR